MSWFKRKPKLKEPPKHLPHHRNSPTTDRLLKETKDLSGPKPVKNITKSQK